MKAISKKTKTNYISLPKPLVAELRSLNLSTTETSHSFKLVGLILRNGFMHYDDIFSYVSLPSTYLTNTFGPRYMDWIKILLEKEIIIRSSYFSYIGKSECYSYKINIKYWNIFNTNTIPLFTKNRSELIDTVEYKEIIKSYIEDENTMTKYFTQDMNSLTIDHDSLRDIVYTKVNSLSLNDFRVNEQIRENTVTLQNIEGNKYHIGRDVAIEKATKEGKVLIQDMAIFRIAEPNEFIRLKKISIEFAYNNSIDTIQAKAYRAKRNSTNMRLDTNLTNMCSGIVDEICKQNNLVQIDLKNSQFALLSYILNSHLTTEDYSLFKQLSISGELYDYIKNEMSLDSRKEAKKVMFELMFSSRNNNTPRKKMLKTMFPSVVKWIDNYKKVNGDEAFAVMLQNVESKLFIDGLFMKIKKARIFCLTKHDSVIIRSKDQAKVMKILEGLFTKEGLEYTLDIKSNYESKVSQDQPAEIVPQIEDKQPTLRDMKKEVNIFNELSTTDMKANDVSFIMYKINKSSCLLGELVQTMIKLFKEKNYNDFSGPIITLELIDAVRYGRDI